MSIYKVIVYILFYSCFTLVSVNLAFNPEDCEKVRTAGTGTVLFNPTDIYKTCWSQEEVAILTARMILEDVIPDSRKISIQCNSDVEDMVDYFKGVIDAIRSSTKGRKRHIMLQALTDLLGGYLHHAILPLARKAYYAGAVDYSFMEKLIQLYEELKWFLRTNGQGWTKPIFANKDVKVPPIEFDQDIHKKPNDSCCQKLLFYEHEPLKTRKRSVSLDKGIYFPLPFFDAKVRPTAIVVPLKKFALRNIESKRSAYVVMKYFISAHQCLKEKNAKPEIVQKFLNNLYTWIERQVLPKLRDDKFYSAFGGIMRVENTLRLLGAKIGPVSCNSEEGEEEVGAVPAVGCSSRRTKLFLMAMLVIIFAWFIIGTCFICYRMKNGKGTKTIEKTGDVGKNTSKRSGSSSSFSSSRWSSMLSRSSSKSSRSKTTEKNLCKCCASTVSAKSTADYTSTSEYESEKSRKKDKSKSFRPSTSFSKKGSKSTPCICPNNGPAVIDAKHSMKVLPSIAEMSENSMTTKEKNGSFRKISFADESGISSSDGGIKPCAPPRGQSMQTIPCPKLSDKSTSYSSSRSTAKGQPIAPDACLCPYTIEAPIANSTHYNAREPTQHNFDQSAGPKDYSTRQITSQSGATSQHFDQSQPRNAQQMSAEYGYGSPMANSTLIQDTSGTANDFDTSNVSTTPAEESYRQETNKSKRLATLESMEEYSDNEETVLKKEPEDKTYHDFHMSACHSSISGNYDCFHKPGPNKPYIFGYDFQTSTSSDLSDDDTISTSKY